MRRSAILPTIQELAFEVKLAKQECNGSDIDITIGWTPGSDWNTQLGDNSYTGSAYGHPIWAVETVDSKSNCREVAKALQAQLEEATWDNPEYAQYR